MFSKKFNFSNLTLENEFEKTRKKILLEKKLSNQKEKQQELFGIENFWIITKSGIALFSLEKSIFTNFDELNLFAGFISAIVSLSQHLSKANLTEIKIDRLSLHIQIFEEFYLVSLISSNHDISLKYLAKLVTLYSYQINESNTLNGLKKEPLQEFKKEFYSLKNDPEIRKEILLTSSWEYISHFVFGLLEIDDFLKKIYLIINYVPYTTRKEFVLNLKSYLDKIKSIKVNSEIFDQLKLIIDSIDYFIKYSEDNSELNYKNYTKSLFVIFSHFVTGFFPSK